MLFQGQYFAVSLVFPRGAVLRRCSGAESQLSLERLANLGRACGHGLCPGSLSTLSRTSSLWWQGSLVLLMWYFLLSFGWETGHLCCHHLLLLLQQPCKREKIPCMLKPGFPELFLPPFFFKFYFHSPGRFLWNQKKEKNKKIKKRSKRELPLCWWKDEANFPEMALKYRPAVDHKKRGLVLLFPKWICFPQLFWIKGKIPTKRKHSQLPQLSWQAKDNGSWHVQSPDIAWSHWCHCSKWPQQE